MDVFVLQYRAGGRGRALNEGTRCPGIWALAFLMLSLLPKDNYAPLMADLSHNQ